MSGAQECVHLRIPPLTWGSGCDQHSTEVRVVVGNTDVRGFIADARATTRPWRGWEHLGGDEAAIRLFMIAALRAALAELEGEWATD